MALTLDPTLEAAMDSQSRRPIVEIKSSQFVDDIPFDGQLLTGSTTDEQKPNIITHSSGRLCAAYLYGNDPTFGANEFRYLYTDVNRQTFSIVEFTLAVGWGPIDEVSICELENGNIGLILIITVSGNINIYRMVLSPTGSTVTSLTQVATYSVASYSISSPWVLKLANDTYILVYHHKNKGSGAYSIMKRTSADFVTWSSESAISLTGLTANYPKYNPSLLQILDGDLFLWFDYREDLSGNNELTNIYYTISSDNGSSWSTPEKVTSYTSFGQVGKHPVACQKVADQMHLIFNEVMGALHIDHNTGGYCGPAALYPTDIIWDSTNRKIYVICSYTSGTRMLQAVIKVDLDTWVIDNCWDCTTVPAFNSAWCSGSGFIFHGRNHGEGSKIPVAITNLPTAPKSIALVDGEADTITFYHFVDSVGYGITANVTGASISGYYLVSSWYDETNSRLYAVFIKGGGIKIGYINSGEYSWNEIVNETYIGTYDAAGLMSANGQFIVDNENGTLIVSMGHLQTGATYTGRLKIYDLSSGGILKDYKTSAYTEFPYHGLYRIARIGKKIYGSFQYDSGIVGESDKRGLCCVDTLTDEITFKRPSWATLDDYSLREVVAMGDEKIACNAPSHGVTIFTLSDETWELFNNDNIPGMTSTGEDNFNYALGYDDDDGYLITGQGSSGNTWNGLILFSEDGTFKRAYYKEGSKSGTWSFGVSNIMVQGISDYDLVPALDPDDQSIYAFWTNLRNELLSIKWDKENSEFDLSSYITRDDEIVLERSINADPTTLSFSVSHGHLFDPTNLASLWSIYLKKFRKINLRFGENISGTEYWQQQAVVMIRDVSLDYERPNYPKIKVTAKDKIDIWDIQEITATEYYETDPKTILEDVMTTLAGLDLAETDFPVFDAAVTLYYQWVESTIKDILTQICDRFGYYPRIDINGKITARKIAEDNDIDHAFSGKDWMKKYTPDLSFSSWLNRVIVKGQGIDYVEVVFAEEPIVSISGTTGWWGGHRHRTAWYAEDGSRKCRYPRLEIIESVRDYNFKLGGGGEEIESVDSDERYCIILIDCPNMIGWLIGLIAAYIAIAYACSFCDGEYMCGICSVAKAVILYVILYILASSASYQYRIHAKPIGTVRQSFQAQSNDEEIQNLINAVIPTTINDALCYAYEHCKFVADFEMMITRLQRNRVKMEKLADLRDEDGDTITFPHPYSDLTTKIFITNLTRRMKLPSTIQSQDGYFLDEIEGWNLG